MNYEENNLYDVVTPIDVEQLEQLLTEWQYDSDKSRHLIEGFTEGFDIGYRGPGDRKDKSANIPISVGSKTEMWNKVMKEVKLHRYAGPFKDPPAEYYIQSPIGLMPKAGNKTRLIFHLSYDFGPLERNKSVNHHTPKELCSVKYNNLDEAIRCSLRLLALWGSEQFCIFYAKSDCSSAYRILPIKPEQRKFLMLMVEHPLTGEKFYFMEKCLPFGSSISCAQFQAFLDALKHIVQFKLSVIIVYPAITNYLDDFFFNSFATGYL